MRIYLEDEGDMNLNLDYMELSEEVAEAVLDAEECPYEAQVELLLTMNDEIHQMNKEFREIDRPTDVLSFPMIDFPEPADYAFLVEDESCFDPETGELMLGNIVISKEKVISQAEEYGHSVKREFSFLIAHSMLHLLGYDHMEEEEKKQMRAKEENVLNQLNITRE